MFMRSRTAGLTVLGLAIWALTALSSPAQQPSKDEEIRRTQDEVKRLVAELDKLAEQAYETQRRLSKAMDRLDELEGKGGRWRSGFGGFGGFGRGGFGPFGGGDWREFMRRFEPKAPAPPTPPPPAAGDVEKRLEKLMRELEDLRRELRRP